MQIALIRVVCVRRRDETTHVELLYVGWVQPRSLLNLIPCPTYTGPNGNYYKFTIILLSVRIRTIPAVHTHYILYVKIAYPDIIGSKHTAGTTTPPPPPQVSRNYIIIYIIILLCVLTRERGRDFCVSNYPLSKTVCARVRVRIWGGKH